ncbi:MAG: tetratricopeptide repeat protein [Akkermansiaceae bacterium]
MKIKFSSFPFSVLSICFAAAEPLPLSTSYWKDPAFLKSFNGSYRIEARIEPNVTTEERGLLLEVQKLMADGKRQPALEKIQSSKLTKDSAALTFNLANLQFELGETEKAIESYSAALEKYPSFRRAHRNLALAYVRENQIDKAITHLTEAIRLGDADGSTYGLLGYARLSREEFASALQAYRLAQVTEPNVAEWKAGIAQCLQNLDEKAEAIALLEEVIRQRPTEASYSVLKANIHLELDQPKQAAKALELPFRLENLDPDATLLLADLHLRAQREAPAKSAIETAFSSEETAPSLAATLRLISTASAQQNWSIAKELLEHAKTENPPLPLRLAKARYLIESEEDSQTGQNELDTILKEDPTNGTALIILAKHLSSKDQLGAAELLFERATADSTTAYEAFVELARLHVSKSRYTEALKAVDSALALNPTEDLQTYRTALESTVAASQ